MPPPIADSAARARLSRRVHRTLAWLVGLQLLAWTASGLYMTAVDLDFVHGDTLVRNLAPTIDAGAVRHDFDALRARFPDLRRATLRARADDGRPVYEVTTAAGTALVDANRGRVLSPLPEREIAALARAYYAGDGPLASLQLLEGEAPGEIRGRTLPLWRAEFDDGFATTLYLHPDTGRLVTRRHRGWRWFDLLWSLHIMDYRERERVDTPLLRTASVLALVTAGSGLWLAVYAFRRPARRRA